ncbi:hypothetical protein ABFX02_14G048200 [Erythranthe guttata]
MKSHVAFLPSPGMGHMIPLFQLAKKLTLQHGFRVSFIVITTGASAAQNQFFHSAAAISPHLSIINLPAADVSGVISEEMRVVTQIAVIARESLKPLKPILAELKPSSLVVDIFTTDAIDTCTDLRIPVYSFFTASTALLTLSLYLPTLDREVEGEYVDLPAPVEIPGCRNMPTADLLDQVKDRTNDEYKWYLLHVSRLPYTAGILVNAWDDLDQQRIKALTENPFFKNLPTPPIYPVGPLIKDDEILTEKDATILAWLDSQPRESVLFVCLGSGGTLSSRQLIELAAGLELSRQRFLLVARPPTDASGAGAYFSVGSGGGEDADGLSVYFPDGFLDRTRGVGLVVPAWAPQMAVLRHRSTGGFLSHCGWNSTLESLVCGVPMIAWPLYAEQRMNATMLVEEVGVAVKVAGVAEEEEVIGREEIGRVVRAVMEGEEGKVIRRRAGELKENARKSSENGVGLSRFVDICHLDI